MAVLAQDPKSDPASILSPALVSDGRLGKEKKKNPLKEISPLRSFLVQKKIC